QGTTTNGGTATLCFDVETGLLVRLVRFSNSPVGRVVTRVDYSDYRQVAGVKMPFQWTVTWLDGRSTYELTSVEPNVAIDASHFATTPGSGRGVRLRLDHMTYYTPLQDSAGIITPASLHFMQTHSSRLPDIDPQQHRLTIHGMVDRPLSFTLEELKRLPSVSRIYFVECHGNGSSVLHGTDDPKMGLPVQYIHGMTSCSEWTGVPLSMLLKEAGVQ